MEAVAEYRGGSKFEVRARHHAVICDQPVDNKGSDEGMTPPEFLLASLAACAGYYAAQYLNTRGLSAADLKVTVTAEKAMHPARLGAFAIEITAPGLDERQRNGVARAARACLIHNTLLSPPSIEVRMTEDSTEDDRDALDKVA